MIAPLQAADEPAGSPEFLATVQVSQDLQEFLQQTVDGILSTDAAARRARTRISLIVLEPGRKPRLAHINGDEPGYPASVVKFVYLMAAFNERDQGRLQIDRSLDRKLTEMIVHSSNRATQQVVARVTDTRPGEELPQTAYLQFRHRRLAVKRWLQRLGIEGIHSIHPTYDGGDLSGRELQLLRDASVEGGISSADGRYRNRQSMTANATSRLLALLATDRALSAGSSESVRTRMLRDPARQPYQRFRISGGALAAGDFSVYSKSGTWGPVFADAGIVKHASGASLVLSVFMESVPAYRGDFIARLARACASALLPG